MKCLSKNCSCAPCKKREYDRIRYLAKKEEIDAKNKAWKVANPEKYQESIDAWRAKNVDKVKAQVKAYATENKDRLREANKAWVGANRDAVRAIQARYRDRHRLRLRAMHSLRGAQKKAKRRGAPGKLSAGIVRKLLSLQRSQCAVCRASIRLKRHIDHIVAISNGGENIDSNVQLLCPTCNMQKHTKDPIDFMQSRGYLL